MAPGYNDIIDDASREAALIGQQQPACLFSKVLLHSLLLLLLVI
jgi:hypothetical protein